MFVKSIMLDFCIYNYPISLYNEKRKYPTDRRFQKMTFAPFDNSREHMELQYERYGALADKERAESLYGRIRAAYDNESSPLLGKAMAIAQYFDETEIFINPHDIFADLCDTAITSTPVRIRKEIYSSFHKKSGEARRLSASGAIFAQGDYSHTMPDWERLLSLGFSGIADEAESKLAGAKDESSAAFYRAIAVTYRAIIRYALRLADAAHEAGSENALFAEKNLRAIAHRAPKTLAEAMQLYFVFYTVQHHAEGALLRSLGSIDLILYGFYERDKQNGASDEEIRELIRYFLFKWSSMRAVANIPFDISDEPNELSYILIDEYVKLNVYDPKIHIKVSEHTPKELLLKVLDAIRQGKNSFVFINDNVVRASLEKIGIDARDAKNYTLVGCYEPCVVGCELPCTVNGKIPLPFAITHALADVKEGRVMAPETYEEFYSLVITHIAHLADVCCTEISTIERKYPSFMQAPALSGSYSSCMESATEIYAGGAKYNSSSVNAYGIASYVDSMLAVKRAVYDERLIDLNTLIDILDKNWEGEDALRRKIRRFPEKYGNANRDADELTKKTVDTLSDMINGRENGRGGVFRLGMFSINWIFESGKKLGATPDGRLTGEPVSKNLSTVLGMDKNGITAHIRSALSLDHTKIPNGNVLDLSLHPTAVAGNEGLMIMESILKLYITGGGFGVQFNVVNPDDLRAAQSNPEGYKNLQVRLCGWNVYFNDLEREVQDNLIESMVNI